jgi:hypothetical protein
MRFLRNVWITVVLLSKTLALMAVIGAVMSLIVVPATELSIHIHWVLGVGYGAVSLVLVIAGIGTWVEKIENKRPIMDWLEKLPGDGQSE